MNMESLLEMGGYARYVWSAYGLSLGLMAVHLALIVIRHRRLRRTLARGLGTGGGETR
ncbi:heme exporter protein CcmD [Thiohalobacter sp.]|uniref:heme exporter protein CcmD n=1 Tax=Thiohalobacter sp. TaxID=2025948 RepID=UPI002634E0D2|nr:heme exporter protein CcmD [Thiohalobacter sp.]